MIKDVVEACPNSFRAKLKTWELEEGGSYRLYAFARRTWGEAEDRLSNVCTLPEWNLDGPADLRVFFGQFVHVSLRSA